MGAVVHIYHPNAVEIAAQLRQISTGHEVVACETEQQLKGAIGDIEVLFSGRLPQGILRDATRLRWIQQMGAGVDSLLPAPEMPEQVAVTCARGIYAPQVAEHAVGLLLSLHRGFASHHQSQKERQWRTFPSTPLAGKTLVVLGLGEIGSRVARIGDALGMKVHGVSRTGAPVESVDKVFRSDDLTSAIADTAAMIVTLPLTPQTAKIIGERELAAMPRHSLVVNIGRGGLIDEPALLAALQSGHIGGAALDVFETEPLPSGSPWWTAPNTIVTPHCSGTTVDHMGGICVFFASNLARYDAGEPLLNLVDRDLCY